jgi:hypothetical protein
MRKTVIILTVTLVIVAATIACAAPGGLSLEKKMAADTLGISVSDTTEELAHMQIQKTEDTYNANNPQLTPEEAEWRDLEMLAQKFNISISGMTIDEAKKAIQEAEGAYNANIPQLTPEQEWQDLEMLAQKFNISISGMTIDEAKKAIQEAEDAYIASMLVQKTG